MISLYLFHICHTLGIQLPRFKQDTRVYQIFVDHFLTSDVE